MTSPDDMKVLPVIDKSVLIRNNGDIQSTYKFDKLQFSETSGSSESPCSSIEMKSGIQDIGPP